MKTQTHISELDATKLANLQLRQQLLAAEVQAFQAQLFVGYGNEGERIAIQADNSIVRTPKEKPAPVGKKARK